MASLKRMPGTFDGFVTGLIGPLLRAHKSLAFGCVFKLYQIKHSIDFKALEEAKITQIARLGKRQLHSVLMRCTMYSSHTESRVSAREPRTEFLFCTNLNIQGMLTYSILVICSYLQTVHLSLIMFELC